MDIFTQITFLIASLVIATLVVFRWNLIKFYGAILFYVPVFLEILCLKIKMKFFYYMAVKRLEQGRFTHWYKRFFNTYIKIDDLTSGVVSSIKSFVLGEKGMPIRIQPVGETVEYVPKSERELPKQEQSVILMEKRPRREIVKIRNKMLGLTKKGRVNALRNAEVAYDITLEQFKGWRNVKSSDGTDVPFDDSKKEEMYDMLPLSLQVELESEFGGGILTEEEKARLEEEEDDEDLEDDEEDEESDSE